MNIRKKRKFEKKDLAVILISVLMIVLFWCVWWSTIQNRWGKEKQSTVIQNNSNRQNAETGEWRCLRDNEEAYYPLRDGTREELGIPEYPLTVFIKNKNTQKEIFKFQVDNVLEGHYHPVEIRKCGIYIIREFNFDEKEFKPSPGFNVGLWKYGYDGNGELIISFSDEDYSYDFRTDFFERFVVLEKGYFGTDDFSLVIKDLKTKEDVFILPHKEVAETKPNWKGIFGMKEWTKDGKYYWGSIFAGAQVVGFFRVDADTWQYEFFDVPKGLMGGDKLNAETGWITYHTDLVWTGMRDWQEEIKQERREQGIGTKFYLYNLITKEKILVYETDEPVYFTKPKWISDTEIEYELPGGESKIYELISR